MQSLARVAELVDARDLKSLDPRIVPVQVRPWAPRFALRATRGTATVETVRRSSALQSSESEAWALCNNKELRLSMWYVYILRSTNEPNQEYVGATANLKKRVADHNDGKSTHTKKFMPWKLVWYCAFTDKYKALTFEKYLKPHSGKAFANKRLV